MNNKYRKKTNGFDTSIFGIDLFIKWIYQKLKEKKSKEK